MSTVTATVLQTMRAEISDFEDMIVLHSVGVRAMGQHDIADQLSRLAARLRGLIEEAARIENASRSL